MILKLFAGVPVADDTFGTEGFPSSDIFSPPKNKVSAEFTSSTNKDAQDNSGTEFTSPTNKDAQDSSHLPPMPDISQESIPENEELFDAEGLPIMPSPEAFDEDCEIVEDCVDDYVIDGDCEEEVYIDCDELGEWDCSEEVFIECGDLDLDYEEDCIEEEQVICE